MQCTSRASTVPNGLNRLRARLGCSSRTAIGVSRSSAEPVRLRCEYTIRSLRTCWHTTGFRRIRRVNGGASQANSRPTKSRRSSRRGLSSRGSSTTTRPLVSLTSSWTVSHGSWSLSDVQTVPCMCCSPMPPAASQRTPPADHFRLTDRTPAERWPLTSTGLRTCRARSPTLRRARWRPPRTGWPSPSKPARKTRVESGTAGRSGPRTVLKHTIDLAQNVEALKPIVTPDRHPSAKSSTSDAGVRMGYARQLKILAPQGLGFETMDTPASAEVVFYEAGDPWPPGHLDTTVVVVSFENAAAIGARLVELTSGRLRAALDVTDPEPFPAGHPLWSAPGLLLTPHVAGSTEGAWERAWAVAMRQIAIFAGGDTPPNLVAGRGAG